MRTRILPKQAAFFLFQPLIYFMLLSNHLQAQVSKPLPQEIQANSNNKVKSQFTKSKLSCKVIDAPNKTFGYDIYADGRMMIHQPSAPALPGNEGFKTKADALKVAQLVIGKIKKGEMPPTVTNEEMKKLRVIN